MVTHVLNTQMETCTQQSVNQVRFQSECVLCAAMSTMPSKSYSVKKHKRGLTKSFVNQMQLTFHIN